MSRSAMRTLCLLSFIALLALGGSSCALRWVKRAPGVPAETGAPALMCGLTATMTNNSGSGSRSNASLVSAAVAVHNNTQLESLARPLEEAAVRVLKAKGYEVYFDEVRAKRSDVLFKTGNDLTALTGAWTHPQASGLTPGHFRFAIGVNRKEIVGRINVEGRDEYFAFVQAAVGENSDVAIGFLKFGVRPLVDLAVVVLDRRGVKVLDAQGRGEGAKSAGLSVFDPANLALALERAEKDLMAQPEQPLK